MDNKNTEDNNEERVEETTPEEEAEETSAETEEETASDDDFDYKSEYEKLNKKDYSFEKLRRENKELKEKLENPVEDDEDDVKSIIKKELGTQFGTLRQELLGDKLDKEIASLTDNEYAQKLIKLNLEKYPEMSVKEAWALANAGKLKTQMKEAKKTASSKERKGDGSGVGQRETKSTAPQLAPVDTATIKRMGLKWDGTQFTKKDGRFALKPTASGGLEQIRLK